MAASRSIDVFHKLEKYQGWAITGRNFNQIIGDTEVPIKLFHYVYPNGVRILGTTMILLDSFIRSADAKKSERIGADEFAQVQVHDDAVVHINYPTLAISDDKITLSECRPFVPEEWLKRDDLLSLLRSDLALVRYALPRMKDQVLRAAIRDEALDHPSFSNFVPKKDLSLDDLASRLDINGDLIYTIIDQFAAELTPEERDALCIRAISAKHGARLDGIPTVAISLPVVLHFIEHHKDNPVWFGHQIRAVGIGGLASPIDAIDQVIDALFKHGDWFHLDRVDDISVTRLAFRMLNQRPENVNNIACSSIKPTTLAWMKEKAPKAYELLKQRILSGEDAPPSEVKCFVDAYPETLFEF